MFCSLGFPAPSSSFSLAWEVLFFGPFHPSQSQNPHPLVEQLAVFAVVQVQTSPNLEKAKTKFVRGENEAVGENEVV